MHGAGMTVEDSKGECNLGQHEINFHYSDALTTCDRHVVFKNGAKEIAAQHGQAITFMAKYDAREGNSCHLHLSLADAAGKNVFAADEQLFDHFLAGAIAGLRELTLLLAPNINSYKRFAAGSFAPTAVAWGNDNRTCAFRVVGHGPGRRFECRLPGGDVNPYLALAGLIAAGLHGVENNTKLPPVCTGDAYTSEDYEHVPKTLREARALFAGSEIAKDALGEEVVAHYLNMADVELAAYDAAVTDWERVRGFERL
jgi:glutamine synthetase